MSCEFEKGFTKRYFPYKELTDNDREGLLLVKWLAALLSMIAIGIVALAYRCRSIFWIAIAIGLCCGLILLRLIVTKPVRFLYLGGLMIAKSIDPTGPYLDPDKYFPNHKLFIDKKNFREIEKEVRQMLPQRHKLPLTKYTFGKENHAIGSGMDGKQQDDDDGWRISMVSIGRTISSGGYKNFPKLASLIEKCPEILSCAVSILPGNKGIPIHIGYYKGFIRYQLGVVIPKDRKKCFICVNGEPYHWKRGADVMFDDTFAHKVYNNTDEIRVVIYMDIARAFLTPTVQMFNEFVLQIFENSESLKEEISRTEYQIDLSK
jgi:aspartyl/asparaginyl beta-hydroxylase (cupin superfamily)